MSGTPDNVAIHVNPGDQLYEDALVSASLDLGQGDALWMEEIDPKDQPRTATWAQRVGDAWVWVLPGITQPGQPRGFRVMSRLGRDEFDHLLLYEGVRVRQWETDPSQDRALDFEIDGDRFATYNYGWRHGGMWKPFFHPIYSPSGFPITQNSEFPGTLRGHYWHRGLFIAHQRVNGVSFWEEREGEQATGRILHQEFALLEQGPVVGRFVERNLWRTPSGVDLINEQREVRTYRLTPSQRILDFTITLKPANETITLGKAAYNLLACLVPRSMHTADPVSDWDTRVYRQSEMRPGERGGGRITTSEGEVNVVHKHNTGGARARWVDHSGPLGPSWQGVATFDHPDNPRFPTYWLNWNNMTHSPSFTFSEPYIIEIGDTLELRYRVYFHDGDVKSGKVEQKWREFSKQINVNVSKI